MNEFDDLDRRITEAYRVRSERMGDIRIDAPSFVAPRARTANGYRTATGYRTAAVMAVGVLAVAGVLALRPTTDGVTVGSPSPGTGPQGTWAPIPPVATGPMPVPPWWGINPSSEPGVHLLSASRLDGPRRVAGARFVTELRKDDDWRSRPAVSVVLVDRAETAVSSPGTTSRRTLAGRPATRQAIGRTAVETVVELGPGEALRIHSIGVDDDTLAAIVSATRTTAGALSFAELPNGLRVMTSASADREPFHKTTVTYSLPEADQRELPGTLRVQAVDDPVAVAEAAIVDRDSNAGSAVETTIAGQPAVRLSERGDAVWRVGSVLYRLEPWTSTPAQTELAARATASLHALSPAEAQALAVTEASVTEWDTDQMHQPTAPVDAAVQRKIDAFYAAAPAGFAPFTADPPTPIEEGYRVRMYGVTDAWIDLSMVRSTTGAPAGDTTVQVERDLLGSKTLRWRAPSGWTFRLSVDSKNLDIPPALNDRQMRDLLQRIDQS